MSFLVLAMVASGMLRATIAWNTRNINPTASLCKTTFIFNPSSRFQNRNAVNIQLQPRSSKSMAMAMSETSKSSDDTGFDAAAWFNPSTRGGVIVWSILITLIPLGFYNYFVSTGMEETTVGAYVGAIFVLLSNVAWASTYLFRVATKDMTYAQQLRDYENAVLQKRLEELGDDEINALMEEIEREDSKTSPPSASSVTTMINKDDL